MEIGSPMQPITTDHNEEQVSLTPGDSRATASACRLRNILRVFQHKKPTDRPQPSKVPTISPERRAATWRDEDSSSGSDTKLYLAYGSNLCHETFQGKRGIRPLAQMNVVVPSLRMTFDLPGIPYIEPCFANSALRNPSTPTKSEHTPPDYHKNRWKKGMVGVVYEVTEADYIHIIATEGGGASYKDVLVKCFPLKDGEDEVPEFPTADAFRCHTLFAPAIPPGDHSSTGRFQRPDPSYAQPSARYLKLITDGANEHSLPKEYNDYLHDIRPYEARSASTRLGAFVFTMLWQPFLLFYFSLLLQYQREDGTVPNWVAKLGGMIFGAVWTSYDSIFKPIFGDGERTDYSKKRKASEDEWNSQNRYRDDEEIALKR